MSRIRTVKPELFKHEDLYDLESDTGLPIRVAFIAMFTVADREGRFKWRPRTLKVECFPHDECDFSRVLDALATRGFVVKYASNGESFGYIPSFNKHQVVNNRESPSELPAPNENNILTRAPRVDDACPTPLVQDQGEGKGREQEGKGREVRDADASLADGEPPAIDLKIEIERKKLAESRSRMRDLGQQWNSLAGEYGLPQIEEIKAGSPREVSALARIREAQNYERIFAKIRGSPFLRGERGRSPCTFDWINNPTNALKILEGNYDEVRQTGQHRAYGAQR